MPANSKVSAEQWQVAMLVIVLLLPVLASDSFSQAPTRFSFACCSESPPLPFLLPFEFDRLL